MPQSTNNYFHYRITHRFYTNINITVPHVKHLSDVGWKDIHACVYTARGTHPKDSNEYQVFTKCEDGSLGTFHINILSIALLCDSFKGAYGKDKLLKLK